MTKIEEIKYAVLEVTGATDYEDCINQCMKEYAEYYARKCLEIAALKVKMKWEWVGDDSNDGMQIVDKDSILNIELPKHV